MDNFGDWILLISTVFYIVWLILLTAGMVYWVRIKWYNLREAKKLKKGNKNEKKRKNN